MYTESASKAGTTTQAVSPKAITPLSYLYKLLNISSPQKRNMQIRDVQRDTHMNMYKKLTMHKKINNTHKLPIMTD